MSLKNAIALGGIAALVLTSPVVSQTNPSSQPNPAIVKAQQDKVYSVNVHPPEAEQWSKYNLPYVFEISGNAETMRAAYNKMRELDIIPNTGLAHDILERLIMELNGNPLLLAKSFSVSEPEPSGTGTANLSYSRDQSERGQRTYTSLHFQGRLRKDGSAEIVKLDTYDVLAKRWAYKYHEVERHSHLNREEWFYHVSDLELAGGVGVYGRHATILPVMKNDNTTLPELDLDGFRERIEKAIKVQILRFTPDWKPIGQRLAQRVD